MRSSAFSFLDPKSVVVIGVSRKKDKIGRTIFDQLIKLKLEVYGVNPHAIRIDNRKIYKDSYLIPPNIELAVYAIPAEFIPMEVEKTARNGIKNHLIISSGFKEAGEDGQKREMELLKLVETYKINIQGPNCLGNISPVFNTNISFGNTPPKGNIGLILQSGAIGTAFLDWAKEQNIGISHFVSLGNKLDLSENDFLEFFGTDKNTKVIGLYLENLKNAKIFLDIAHNISLKKPIVILSPGKTKAAKMAISSHTGALAGNFTASEAAFSQVGIIEASDLQQFFLLLELLGRGYPSEIKNTLVITNAGGPSVLLTDNLSSHGFNLYQPTEKENNKLIRQGITFRNPFDLLGDADHDRLKQALEIITAKQRDLLLFILLTPQENTDLMAMARVICTFKKTFKGVLIVNLIGGEHVLPAMSYLRSKKVVVSTFIEDLVSGLIKIREYQKTSLIKHNRFIPKLNLSLTMKRKITSMLKAAQGFLKEEDSLFIAQAYGLPLAETFFLNSNAQGIDVARKIGFPVVLKISSPKIIHRNQEQGVFLDIKSEKELETDYDILNIRKGQIILQKKVEAEAEVIVGAKKDPEFSHLLAFGSGGIHVEYLRDIQFAVIPFFSFQTMVNLISKTKIGPYIKNHKQMWNIFVSLINLLHDFPQIDEIDLNPIMISQDHLRCVDVKIKV